MAEQVYQIKNKPYFYDAQIKRYLLQIMSCFAGYRVQSGVQRDGKKRMISVPIIYGDYSRTVSYIMSGGNEGNLPKVPILSLYATSLQQNKEHRRAPQHYEKVMYNNRSPGSYEGMLGTEKGDFMTMERYIPVPYDMDLTLSLWASNNDQGFQMIEQIATYFNPELEIQLSNSPFDWTFLTNLTYKGNVDFKRVSAGLGEGTGEDAHYVFDMDFEIMVQISPPAKQYAGKSIESVHTNIKELNETVDWDTMTDLDNFVITGQDD